MNDAATSAVPAEDREELQQQIEYMTGVRKPGVINDYRDDKVAAAIVRCREHGDDETAHVLARMSLHYRQNQNEWFERLAVTEATIRAEALTPSGDTKAAYLGQFEFDIMVPSIDEDNDDLVRQTVTVPWATVKEIMKAIRARALAGEGAG